jgi:hypothetical protein
LQMSTLLTIDAYSGESNHFLSLKTDPKLYFPNANNNFIFNCDYNAPQGSVNFVFPDFPCESPFEFFDAYAGEVSYVISLGGGADLDGLIDTGEELFIDILTVSIISVEPAYTGEVGSLIALQVPDYSTYILTQGPSAYWKFDELTGTSAVDSTGQNSAATITECTLGHPSPVASKFAFYFDGVNDKVVGPPFAISSNNITQELWVKPDVGATITLYAAASTGTQGVTGQRYAVFPYWNGSGSGPGLSIGTNGIQVVAHGDSYLPILLTYQQPISTTEFTHVLVSWANRTPTLYINGVAVGTGFTARSPFTAQGLPQGIAYGNYKGYMQDVAIYNSSTSAAQARDHYLAGIGLHYIPRLEPVLGYNGESFAFDLDLDLDALGYVRNYTGENSYFDLENNVQLYLDMVGGETLNNLDTDIPITPNSTFTHFYGAATYTVTSTCLTLVGLQSASSTAGINAYFAIGEGALRNDHPLVFKFKRTRATLWYDDDFTDAGLWFCFFPKYTPDQMVFADWTWGYAIPNYFGQSGALIVRLRRSANLPIRVNWVNTALTHFTNNLTVHSDFSTSELDGTDECSLTITGSSTNTIIEVKGAGGVIRQSGTFSNMANPYSNGRNITDSTFLIHHHNYSGNTRSETLCDMSLEFPDSAFVTYPSSNIQPIHYSGENWIIDNLNTTSLIVPNGYSGENLAQLTLTTFPSSGLATTPNLTGENAFAILTVFISIDPNYLAGECNDFDLTIFPGLGLGSIGYHTGESLESNLSTQFNFVIDCYAGESVSAYFAEEVLLSSDAIDGSYLNVTLTEVPPPSLSLQGLSGELGLFENLSTSTFLPSRGYSGEYAVLDLATISSAPIAISFYEGQLAQASMQTAYNLPVTRAMTGEVAVAVTLEFEPFYTAYYGEDAAASLSTTHILPTTAMQTGEVASIVIEVEPPARFVLRAYYGEELSTSFKWVRAVTFRVLFRTNIGTQLDMGSATYFDLTTDECCGERIESNNLLFHLDWGMLPEEVSYGNRTYMTVDLSTTPRFRVTYSTGENFALVDNTPYFEFGFETALQTFKMEWDADLRHRLCKGYFIPSGEWIVTELTDILPEDCYADYFYAGETMSCELSANIVFTLGEFATDNALSFSIVSQEMWRLQAYSGERMYWDTFDINRFVDGAVMSLVFYEPPILGYAGSTATCDIVVENYVRFLEIGCIDNEFFYQNEAGDMIPEMFNPTPVEGEPFMHDLKAECY